MEDSFLLNSIPYLILNIVFVFLLYFILLIGYNLYINLKYYKLQKEIKNKDYFYFIDNKDYIKEQIEKLKELEK